MQSLALVHLKGRGPAARVVAGLAGCDIDREGAYTVPFVVDFVDPYGIAVAACGRPARQLVTFGCCDFNTDLCSSNRSRAIGDVSSDNRCFALAVTSLVRGHRHAENRVRRRSSHGNLTESLPVAPPLSVTDAVMVWAPSAKTFEKLAPVPISPSMLED